MDQVAGCSGGFSTNYLEIALGYSYYIGRNLLNRKIDNALLILCYLHHKQGEGSAREIAAHFDLSRPFVANILKDLCHQGFVASIRGVHGGYRLTDSTPDATLADLMDTLDEPFRLAACNQDQPETCCSMAATCPIKDPIREVHNRLRAVLENITLGELFGRSPSGVVQLEFSRIESPVFAL